MPILIDMVARRYHKLPTEILDLDLFELAFNIAIMRRGLENDAKQIEEISRKDGFICPAWLLLMR